MIRRLAFTALLGLGLAVSSCGGGGGSGDSGGKTNSAAGTAGMAASFADELTKIQTCVQGDLDGKAACTIDFLQDPVSKMCSDVRTGRASQFPGADYSKFTATCDSWKTAIGSINKDKIPLLTQMITDVKAIK